MVDAGRAAVDVGANVGKYAYALSSIVKTVYAFEPDVGLANQLKRSLPTNVKVLALAASDSAGNAELRYPVVNGSRTVGLASIESGVVKSEGHDVAVSVVSKTRLDDVINESIGFIKVDVEGHELSVLKGALRILKEDKPIVLVEAEDRHRPNAVIDVFEFMSSLGYASFFIFEDKLLSGSKFTKDLQNVEELSRPVNRVDMRYVNNFIFVQHSAEANFVERMNATLAGR